VSTRGFIDARTQLARHGLRPKRSFGQNFLVNEGVLRRIAELCAPTEGTFTVEIGAGLGALTSALLDRGGPVVAIERDRELLPVLRETFADELADGRLSLIEDDAAAVDYGALLAARPAPRTICGNLPYQITGRLIERATGLARSIDRAVFMVQREVADRLVAEPGSEAYGQPTVFAQAAFVVERAIIVKSGSFHPRPEVDSAVVTLTPRPTPRALETEAFRAVVHAAFGARRKTLRNALSSISKEESMRAAFEATGIDLGRRGETLSVEEFDVLARAVEAGARG
jgi:16S rRNA (adenine1518-N6/adenine1519-N6)-dimethyltransferase